MKRKMKGINLMIIPALICGVVFTSCATRGFLPNGKYIGLEPMYRWKNLDTAIYKPNPYMYQFPTIYRIHGKDTIYRTPLVLYPGIYQPKETDTTKYWFHSDKWFHEVIIEVLSDNCINISKVPVYFVNGEKKYSENIGGFYFYQSLKVETYSEMAHRHEIRGRKFIHGPLTDCTYCRRSTHAIMQYENCRYDIISVKNGNLLLQTEYGSIIYRKIKKNRLWRN
jgi:hypothetical protein